MADTVARGLAAELYDEAGSANEEKGSPEWRRDAPRRQIQVSVDLEYKDKDGLRTTTARTVNVGLDSLCIVANRRFNGKEPVRIRRAYEAGADWSRGEVIHCTGTLGGYKLGIKMISEPLEPAQLPPTRPSPPAAAARSETAHPAAQTLTAQLLFS